MRSCKACLVTSRPMTAIDSVRGIFFGQTRAQFWALPQLLMPPSSMRTWSLSSDCIFPVGWALKRRTWEIGAGPMNFEWAFTCGQASVQQPHVMHVERRYIVSWTLGLILGPKPRSNEPSTSIQARTFFRFSNIESRLTTRSRTKGNFVMGASVMTELPVASRIGLISAVHAWRGLPLMSIEQEPQTSSKHPCSQAIGWTFSFFRLYGFFWISMSAVMILEKGLSSSSNSSQHWFSGNPRKILSIYRTWLKTWFRTEAKAPAAGAISTSPVLTQLAP